MYCEYCELELSDTADARRHMLSIDHTRGKNQYQLNKNKLDQKTRNELDRPKNVTDLATLLSIHNKDDVNSLYDNKFFAINSDDESRLVRHLIPILFQSSVDHHVNSLPRELQQPFIKAVQKFKK